MNCHSTYCALRPVTFLPISPPGVLRVLLSAEDTFDSLVKNKVGIFSPQMLNANTEVPQL